MLKKRGWGRGVIHQVYLEVIVNSPGRLILECMVHVCLTLYVTKTLKKLKTCSSSTETNYSIKQSLKWVSVVSLS